MIKKYYLDLRSVCHRSGDQQNYCLFIRMVIA